MQQFEKIAPYLQDPLILVGFFLFVFFSFCKLLVSKGIFPQLEQSGAISILKLILGYGFIIGFLIVSLGFGLKYQELSEIEQKRAISLILSEIEGNKYVVSELAKNTISLTETSNTLSNILRDKRFKILNGLFPEENYIKNVNSDTLSDLYNQRMEWLETSGLLNDKSEVMKYKKICAAITRTIEKTQSTLLSLADQKGTRYVINKSAWEANLPIIRKIEIIDISELSQIYSKMSEIRTIYDRVANIVPEYNMNIKKFCSTDLPQLAELGATLALERITYAMLEEYKNNLNLLKIKIDSSIDRLRKIQ